jgi:hypothetical protein
MTDQIKVYLETGQKRTFAGALDWPGWCRSGRDEASALQALFDYAPRYARVAGPDPLGFRAPSGVSAFTVVERLPGSAATDFGAPGALPSADARPLDAVGLPFSQALLAACWQAFDAAACQAAGRELRKGPRGGGRDLEGILRHVLGAEAAYLARLGRKFKAIEDESLDAQLRRLRQAVLEALAAAARGELPSRGPRGGALWPPRYFVRRSAWHVLDHAWEIDDRLV